jgi:hypothetical protein
MVPPKGMSGAYETIRSYYDLYKDEDTVTVKRVGRLRWAGHVIRMEEDRPVKRILVSNPGGARGRGTPKIRWEDGVDDDSKAIGIRNWKSFGLNRETWDKQLRRALPMEGCCANDDDDDDDGDMEISCHEIGHWYKRIY